MAEYPTTKTSSVNLGFVIDADSLKVLEKILSEWQGELEYEVNFSDGFAVTYRNADEIISQPNSDKRVIVSIISGVSDAQGRAVFLTLRSNTEPSIEYTVTGPQKEVAYFSVKLDDWIASCKQWYSALFSSSGELIKVIGGIALALFCAHLVSKRFPASSGGPPLTFIVVGTAEYYLLKLFPRGTFAVGYGQRKNDLFSKIRNGVLLALGVSVLAEILLKAFRP